MLDLPPPSNSRQQDYYILSKPSFATVTRPGDTSNADVCIRISVKVEKATWCKYRCKMMWILQGWCQICGPQPVLQFELLWCPPSTMKCGSFAQGSSHAVAIVNMTASWLKGRSGAKPLSELECCCGKKNATRSSVRACNKPTYSYIFWIWPSICFPSSVDSNVWRLIPLRAGHV